MTQPLADYAAWVGRTETRIDTVTAAPITRLAATLDRGDGHPPSIAPPLAHWLFFLPDEAQSRIGQDGHPERGGFLPPVHELPRRMWAGSRLRLDGEIRVGMALERRSTILSVKAKEGESGRLVFVTVLHEIGEPGKPVLVREEQDIVFRGLGGAAAKAAPSAGEPGPWRRVLQPDPVLLFRYSALTFNAHRIHYDRDYAMNAEGYPGLVVHGPLIATLLIDLVGRHTDRRVASFAFRGVSPLFAGRSMAVNATEPDADGKIRLWAENDEGGLAMTAEASLVPS